MALMVPLPCPTVLVIDDDASLAALLQRALAYEGYRVRTAPDGPSGLAVALDSAPDLVILDLLLPGMDGVEVLRRLRTGEHGRWTVPVLLLTARAAVADRVRGLDAGADDYLTKPFDLEELAARLRALLRRRPPGAGHTLRFADLVVGTASRQVRRGGRAIDLTTKQYELLVYFLRHPRQVLTHEQLLDGVWGVESAAQTHLLEVCVGHLRRRLEHGDPAGEPASRLIHNVRGAGYILREAPGTTPAGSV